MRLRSLVRVLLFSAVVLVAGCDYDGIICDLYGECGASTPQSDQPGSFTLLAMIDFADGNIDDLCQTHDPTYSCFYDLSYNFGAQMSANGWDGTRLETDGVVDGAWTPAITESDFISTHSNLLYFSSHGSPDGELCLRNCNNGTGGNSSIEPGDMIAWSGANWLVIDACGAVNLDSPWAGTFGGSLHGILGFNQDIHGLSNGAQATFVQQIKGFSTAVNAWDLATAFDSVSPFATAMIPAPNKFDVIEAAGGPHFGPNGSTNPQFYDAISGHLQVATIAKMAVAPGQTYSLVPESMNEGYWNTYYGGSSIASTISHPTPNENVYRSPYVYVDHYLASGGLMVATAETGTAKGFGEDDAYQYALSWLADNGGLPSDAVLTYSGIQTVSPTSVSATADAPFPAVRQYIFVWRHAYSGVVGGDKIQVNVDDAGAPTTYITDTGNAYNAKCRCTEPHYVYRMGAPWIPVYHMHVYVREWRTIGAPTGPFKVTAVGNATAFGLCASSMSSPQSIATPCGLVSTGDGTGAIDLVSGAQTAKAEEL